MNCEKCGKKTAVNTSRTPLKPGRGSEVNKIAKVVGWYTYEFVARRRKCEHCGHAFYTAELLLTDLNDLMCETAQGNSPYSPEG
tara:strand:+ start:214 stop:465 length:252 start_codon:yes stop_codon:yes gene_type:complete